MRHRKNREINIFSMSALDLFACALGAFFLLMIILFPYYKKETTTKQQLAQSQAEAKSCKAQLTESEQRRQQAEQQRDQAQQQQQQSEQACSKPLGSGVLLVTVYWEHDDKTVRDQNDVDLYAIDPEGKQYWFERPTNAGTRARLSLDSKVTPGFEVFEDAEIRPGTYQFGVRLYKQTATGNLPLTVRARLYTRNGGTDAPPIRIDPSSQAGQMFPLGTITIGPNGEPSVQVSQ